MEQSLVENTLQTVHGLLDIDPPAPPPESSIPVVVSSLALIIFLIALATIAVRHIKSYRSQAKRSLRHLRNKVAQQDIDTKIQDTNFQKETAYQLAHILARGLGVNGITSSTPLPAEMDRYHERWQLFIHKLSLSRFSSENSKAGMTTNSKKMFDDAIFWLKIWP
ncbi:MAG: hypothetical protein U9N50_02155 [Pseudomonadota bacterium]|nr:hypothetical protein [Pseudomonadota bacterium]